MQQIVIRVQGRDDQDKALFPELMGVNPPEGNITMVGVHEDGANTGKAAVAIIVETASGPVLIKTTAAEFCKIAASVREAASRFGETIT